jgi:hypothetical protein
MWRAPGLSKNSSLNKPIVQILPRPASTLNQNFTFKMGLLNLNIKWALHKWAILYCMVSTIGALCYGCDTIYYTGIQGMKVFIRDYGTQKADGTCALTTNFSLLLSPSSTWASFAVPCSLHPSTTDGAARPFSSPPPSASSSKQSYRSAHSASTLSSVLEESLSVSGKLFAADHC